MLQKKIRHKASLPNNLLMMDHKKDFLNDKWQMLVENANDGICVLSGREIIYANPQAYNLLGYTREEVVNCSFKKFIASEELLKIMKMYLSYIAGKKVPRKFESILLHRDGHRIRVELSVNKIKYDSIIIIRDITARKRAEEALRESENTYKTIFENTGTATIIVEEDMTISLVNDQFVKMSGYARDDIINKIKWPVFFIEDDVKKMKEFHNLRRVDPHLAPRNYETCFIDSAGNMKSVYVTVAMIPGTKKSVASFLDITPIKVMENELMVSKKLFDDLVEGAPVAMFVINMDHKIVYWNKELEKMTGFNPSEMIGTSYHWKPFYKKATQMITDMIIDEVKFRDILMIDRYKNMEIEESDERDRIICSDYFKNPAGEKRWIRFVIKPLYDTHNNLVGAIEAVEDLTDHKNMRDSLKSRMREFHVLYLVNDHIRMLYPLKKVLQKITKDLVLACDEIEPARVRVIFDNRIYTNLKKDEKFIRRIHEPITILGKNRGNIELGYITKIENKESFLMKYERKVLRIVASTIARHIQHREIVRRYRKLVDKSVVGIFIVQNGVFHYVNPKFIRIFHRKTKDTVNFSYNDIIQGVCDVNRKNTHYITKGIRGDGRLIDVEVFMQTIDYYGKSAVLGTVQDITKLKNAQERQKNFSAELKLKVAEKTDDLKKANRRLQSLNELKDEFIAVTSHELRSPLTAARGYLSFLAEECVLNTIPEQIRSYFMRVYDNVEVLNNLVNNILDVSRIDLGRFELHLKPMDIVDLVKQSIKSLSFQANEKQLKINFINKLKKGSLILPIDHVRMLQVLRNILDNAIKYSYKGKEINIEIAIRGIGVEIAISDYGMGIRKSEIFAIFNKFKQAKNAQIQYKGGAGLGLFIAKKIIELHNGMIWADSQINKGSVFRIQLPLNVVS